MCKKLITFVCCVLAFAMVSTTYGETVIGNWEDSNDGWGAWVSNSVQPSANLSQQTAVGVTLDSYALVVHQEGWGQALAYDFDYDGSVALAANDTFSIDFSVAAASSGGTIQIEEIILNAEGFGWTNIVTGDKPKFDCWSGSSERTLNLEYSYDPSLFGSVPGYAQIVFALNGMGGQYDFYFDNAKLTPEPATICLLGLGGIDLIRRRK